MTGPIVLVGCGKMGSALLKGWLGRGLGQDEASGIYVIESHGPTAATLKAEVASGAPGLQVFEGVDQIDNNVSPEVVVFAVKPQSLADTVGGYQRFKGPETVFLSIAAGKQIAFFEQSLGTDGAVVRAMPNTPAAIGRGITVACANAEVGEIQKVICQNLLEAVGEIAWVDDEDLMDPVTAVSGSGPAYVFLMIECLAAAGVAAGLDENLAMRLSHATISGAGELARQAEDAPSQLRKNVTSPGGTTEAALGVLMGEDGLQPLLIRAVDAATVRSRALAG